jgi:hypothetical protein
MSYPSIAHSCYPCVDTPIRLVILIDIIQRKTDELAINDSIRVTEVITVGRDRTDEFRSAVLDT